MPPPASRAIARIDGSASADMNTRVAAPSSCSRLRVASARGARVSASAKADHAPVMLGWLMQTEHSPFGRLPSYLGRPASMREWSDQMPASTSRAVRLDSFGGPGVLSIREVPAPQAGPGEIRVRVTAAGLNPMDWIMTADAGTAGRFGLSLPAGFGTDYAGVVDQAGDGVTGFAPGMRVFGGALSRAVADFLGVDAGRGLAGTEGHRTPEGVDARPASTLAIAGRTAAAALAVVAPGPGDTVLIGGAAGGVG